MVSPYQEFVRRARERIKKQGSHSGKFTYTRHAEFKMREYRLSRQKVESVIRRPTRVEEGIVKDTVAVMQPVSPKTEKGKQVWKQEVWVMYQKKNQNAKIKMRNFPVVAGGAAKIISTWRYPGVSPKRNPIPPEILREIEERSTLEEQGNE